MTRPSPPPHEDTLAKNAAAKLLDCFDRSVKLEEYLQSVAAVAGLGAARLAFGTHSLDVTNSKLMYQNAIFGLEGDELRQSQKFLKEATRGIERGTKRGEKWLKAEDKRQGTG